MSWMDVLRIEIVGFLFPDNVGGLPDSFFVAALAVIMVSAIIMKLRDPEIGDKGITDYF